MLDETSDELQLQRLTSPKKCRQVTDKYPDYFTFDVEGWLSNDLNYALKSGENVGFAEYKKPGIYWVHFCFDTSRGKEAIDLTKDMLGKLYEDRSVKIVVGLIAVNNKRAKWLIRQVGFKSLGEIETENGLCEMFYSVKGSSDGSI